MFERLSIRWKILLVSIIPLIVLSVALTIMFGAKRQSYADQEIKTFKAQELIKIKNGLKNYVDIAYETVDSAYKLASENEYLEQRYGKQLTDVIDIAQLMINDVIQKEKNGELTTVEAQMLAASKVKALRYDGGKGYVWINNMKSPFPRMIMHPTVPALDGKILDDTKYNCALGRGENLFVAMKNVCARAGEGFVNYLWPKPTTSGLTSDQPKLSYVRLIPEWRWVIGTGIYVDDAVSDAIGRIKRNIKNMRYDNKTGYFWINDMSTPFPKMVMHPTVPALDGKILDAEKYNCALGKKENLFVAMRNISSEKGEGFVDYLWPKPTKDGLTADQPKLSYVKLYKPLNWVIGTGVYIDTIDEAVAEKTKIVNSQIGGAIVQVVLVVVTSLLIIILILWFFTGKITSPIIESVNFAHKIGLGDLRATISVKGLDEVGKLAQSLRDMSTNIRNLIINISKSSQNVGSSSEQLTSTAQVLTDGADEMSDQSQTVFQASEQIVGNINKVFVIVEKITDSSTVIASTAEEMASNMITVSTSVEEMTSSINEVAGNTVNATKFAEQATNRCKSSNDNVTQLSSSASEIGNIIKLISSIAEQTNLLAINATIEAARAGKAGKGFAVVANEVQDLAKQAAAASKGIANQLEGLQKNTTTVVHDVKDILDINEKLYEITLNITSAVEEQAVTTEDIAKAIAATSSSASVVSKSIQEFSVDIEQEILNNVKIAAHEASEISKNINSIKDSSVKVADGTKVIADASEDLAKMSIELNDQVDKFNM